MPGVSEEELAEAAQFSSLADETPEGRSIVVLAKSYGIREHELHSQADAHFVPFTAETRMSGVDMDGTRLRKGAGDAILGLGGRRGRAGAARAAARARPHRPRGRHAAGRGARQPGARRDLPQGHVKEGMRQRFDQLRAMGIRTVMVTGDNRLTAAKIAEEAGVDDFLAEATPEAQARADQARSRATAAWWR